MDNSEQKIIDASKEDKLEFSFSILVQDNARSEGKELTSASNDLVQRDNYIEPQFWDVESPKVGHTSEKCLQTPLSDGKKGLKRINSFSKWLDAVKGINDSLIEDSDSVNFSNHGGDGFSSRSFLLREQLFSIYDFSPKWGYANCITEVHITGTFLMDQQDVAKYDWSCMFGEIEVPAQVLVDGVLCCHAPPHTAERVTFCVTCSNKLACSEILEFCFRIGSTEDVGITSVHGSNQNDTSLHLQLEKLLSLRSLNQPYNISDSTVEKQRVINKLISMKEEHESYQMEECSSNRCFSKEEVQRQFLKRLMKEKLYSWLVHKVTETGKGPRVLDDKGQGMLHLVAALGYDWAIRPTLMAGVSVNFRDINGWTALHWAALYGREHTITVLLLMGAAPGALTDPSRELSLGKTAADVAFGNEHKGVAGFLAESTLTSLFSSLTVNDPGDGTKVVLTFLERKATPQTCNVLPDHDVFSLKDSLSAICNATQAAHRTYQVYRIQSFQMEKLMNVGIDVINKSDNYAVLFAAARKQKLAHSYGLAHAAVKINKRFLAWKKRKRFLVAPRRIIENQASRGNQPRKHYKTFLWSLGILENLILRWRRKGSGLRGFCQRLLAREFNRQFILSDMEVYDFLKNGKHRIENALGRVTSMIRHQDAQAQYRRLLIIVENIHKNKDKMTEYSPFSSFLGGHLSRSRSFTASCDSHSHSLAGSRHSRSNSFAASCTMEPLVHNDTGSGTGTPTLFLEDADLARSLEANSTYVSFHESSQQQNPVSSNANAGISSSQNPVNNNANAGISSSHFPNPGSDDRESQPSVQGQSRTPQVQANTSTNNSTSERMSPNSDARDELMKRYLGGNHSYLSTDSFSSSSSRTGGTLHIQI